MTNEHSISPLSKNLLVDGCNNNKTQISLLLRMQLERKLLIRGTFRPYWMGSLIVTLSAIEIWAALVSNILQHESIILKNFVLTQHGSKGYPWGFNQVFWPFLINYSTWALEKKIGCRRFNSLFNDPAMLYRKEMSQSGKTCLKEDLKVLELSPSIW